MVWRGVPRPAVLPALALIVALAVSSAGSAQQPAALARGQLHRRAIGEAVLNGRRLPDAALPLRELVIDEAPDLSEEHQRRATHERHDDRFHDCDPKSVCCGRAVYGSAALAG
jgi:hypothetical protein